MTQLIETATFAELELKTRGKFENVNTPLLIMQDCTVPFGVDLASIYCPPAPLRGWQRRSEAPLRAARDF